MTVTRARTNLLEDCKGLYQFLLVLKQTALEKDQTKIISLSLEIPPIDPLAVLWGMAQPGQLHFYLEKSGSEEAIAAIDTAVSLKVKEPCTPSSYGTPSRFDQAQNFIQSCLNNIITPEPLNLPFSEPHFFCSFTFFEEKLTVNSPFPSATIFLPRWQIARQGDRGVVVANINLNKHSNVGAIAEDVWQQFRKIKASSHNLLSFLNFNTENLIKRNITAINNFKSAVTSSLESIQAKKFDKIVLAHAVDVKSSVPFQLFQSLENLRKCHPDCYIFSTSNGKGQSFIGASPERLLSIQNRELVTDALAGSAPRGKTATEDAEFADLLLSSEKERREHLVVLDFITQRLNKLGLTPQVKSMPQLLQLSSIQHIWTPIQAKVPKGVHPLEIVAELHPTPAVAGAPRDIACAKIRRYEPFERSLYAAPLGWIDRRGNAEFIVGIRSALIDGSRARLYAGAGIVSGSDPDKELAEIQLKLQPLLKALV